MLLQTPEALWQAYVWAKEEQVEGILALGYCVCKPRATCVILFYIWRFFFSKFLICCVYPGLEVSIQIRLLLIFLPLTPKSWHDRLEQATLGQWTDMLLCFTFVFMTDTGLLFLFFDIFVYLWNAHFKNRGRKYTITSVLWSYYRKFEGRSIALL